MKMILLTAINAKYIHSNLAVYSLHAFASEAGEEYGQSVEIAEYTINQQVDEILMSIYAKKPDVICFSCYLWNIVYVEQIVRELAKVLPRTEIWLGGPEVSYHARSVLMKMPQVRGVMCGEGEETFLELVQYYHGKIASLGEIDGIAYAVGQRLFPEEYVDETLENRSSAGHDPMENGSSCTEARVIAENPPRRVLDLNRVPFVYMHGTSRSWNANIKENSSSAGDIGMECFRNKIIYYESSRGCPFSCSYCLSSIDKCLRFRDIETVKQELQFLIDREVPQVKFVDRTFNCRHDHAFAIWSYLAEHDKGKTNFHFEVAADLLNEEELRLINSMRPGLIQLEIGVQSTNPKTLRAIRRTMDFERVKGVVERIHAQGNVHQHLDLIAGLPYEDYECFRRSFLDVYALRPEQLQLGFLKVLKGADMEEQAEQYQLLYQERPPFEVLSTRWLSYGDIIRLKGIEEMVEVYYNSGQFVHTLELLEEAFPDAFTMYETLSEYYEIHQLRGLNHSRIRRYEILAAFAAEYDVEKKEEYRELLSLDLYLRENVKNRPAFAGESRVTKEEEAAFYERESAEHRYLRGYEQYDKRQMRKMTHLERVKGALILFDYQNRNILTNQAAVYQVSV